VCACRVSGVVCRLVFMCKGFGSGLPHKLDRGFFSLFKLNTMTRSSPAGSRKKLSLDMW
jgi:hypothetical protein